MSDLLITLCIVIAVLYICSQAGKPTPAAAKAQLGGGARAGCGNSYACQHTKYPFGAWWISFSDPCFRCHAEARMKCHEKFNYDDCYAKVLSTCKDPCKTKGLYSYK
jgi:hypothetical protein